MMETLAIDVGGVLLEKRDLSGSDTNFDVADVRWVPGALEAVKKLKPHFDLYVLSFCGKKTEMETRDALKQYIISEIPEEKWIFTRKREHKVNRMKDYGISTLIDDTQSIIEWVNDAGLKGIHFRGPVYKNWDVVVSNLLNNEKKQVKKLETSVPKFNDINEFPPL